MNKPAPSVARDRGMRRAARHANKVCPAWTAQARAMLIAYLQRSNRPSEFITEHVRVWSATQGLPVPPDGRAWGPVMRGAARHGVIIKCRYTQAETPAAHMRPVTVWSAA